MNRIITIDGPSGAGKTSVARLVAQQLNLPYLPSGKLFRAVAYLAEQNCLNLHANGFLDRLPDLTNLAMQPDGRILYDGQDITDRLAEVTVGSNATILAKNEAVRQHLLDLQRALGANGCVIEGRSTAIEVFPEAAIKIWLTADAQTRISRKAQAEGEGSAGAVLTRDEIDTERRLAPMQKASDAVTIDTTHLSLQRVADRIVQVYWQQ